MPHRRNYQPLLVVLVLIAVAATGWLLYIQWQQRQADTLRQQETAALKQRAADLEKQVATLEAELKSAQGDTAPGETAGIFGPAGEAPSEIEAIEQQVKAFFDTLDGREYVKAYRLENGTHATYCAAVAALAASPPKVAGEAESLAATLGNVSHFYRTMGTKPTQLTAEILQNDAQVLEPAMRLFHAWHTTPGGTLAGRATLPTMYQYASFFLNTLGGRSYLLRRDSKLRLLTTYYSLLVLERANDSGFNPNGIDIRPLIAATTRDMRSQQGLAYRKDYMLQLERLATKYAL